MYLIYGLASLLGFVQSSLANLCITAFVLKMCANFSEQAAYLKVVQDVNVHGIIGIS